MQPIRCLITDDEPLALDVLAGYIGHLDHLQLAGRCNNAIETLNFLQKNKVDLLFLDIQMPGLNGIDFLRTLAQPPKVIFTTAYRDHALDGFELNVLDYLLKPIAFDRFLTAVNKYCSKASESFIPVMNTSASLSDDPFVYVKADKKMLKIFLRDIVYIESLKDHVKLRTRDKDVVTYQKISYLEEKLPDNKFVRIHRSYIVALDKIESFTAESIGINKEELPIGRLYKNEVMKVLMA